MRCCRWRSMQRWPPAAQGDASQRRRRWPWRRALTSLVFCAPAMRAVGAPAELAICRGVLAVWLLNRRGRSFLASWSLFLRVHGGHPDGQYFLCRDELFCILPAGVCASWRRSVPVSQWRRCLPVHHQCALLLVDLMAWRRRWALHRSTPPARLCASGLLGIAWCWWLPWS